MNLKIVEHQKKDNEKVSGALDIFINGENVSHCISHMNIKMDAPGKPKVVIECRPDKLHFDADSLISALAKFNEKWND